MYVIFPLDELLDLNSARGNKRGRATLDKPSYTRQTEEVLPLSQPNQKLPNQLKPPLNQQPQTPKQPALTKQQKSPPSPQQPKQQSQPQKQTLTKAPSKTSVTVSPPPVVVPPHSPVSVPSSNQASNVKKPPTQQQPQKQQTVQPPQQPPDQVTKRQRSSHSTSTETSSTSSTGAKGKTLLSPQSSGGAAVSNRSSWGGSPVSTPFQESCPNRGGSFRAFRDGSVDGNTLKVVDQSRAGSAQDVRGSVQNLKPPINKSNSFRSHLNDSIALRPRQGSVDVGNKKPQGSPSSSLPGTPTQPSPASEAATAASPRKPQETLEQPSSPKQELKGSEAVANKQEISQQLSKEKPTSVVEGVKIKQEVPVQAPPPPPPPRSQQKITNAESLRIQQECLSPVSDSKAHSANQRHPSGRSNRSSESKKPSDLPPSGSGGGARGTAAAAAAAGSANPKNPAGVLGSPRGLQQRNTVMASNEASFRDLTNPSVNESLKAHNAFTFKLVKTGPTSGALEGSQSPDETSDHRS